MQIQNNIPLSTLTTMRLGGLAHEVATISSKDELEEIIAYAQNGHKPFFVIGGGSNIIARAADYAGIIILSRIPGFEILEETDAWTVLRIGAGENWDNTVKRTTELGLSGIEAMSAIPGTVGATPVQNVGAYGQEIADTFVELEAYDTTSHQWITFNKEACHFSYRNSAFKDTDVRHHVITSVTLRLKKDWLTPPFYDSLQRYFDGHQITDYTPATIREAVIAIRASKLPDPKQIANTGSFFKNPIVSQEITDSLLAIYPTMPHFPVADGTVKLAAGWLTEQAGLKGYEAHGLRTYQENALVIVNDSATSYTQLLDFKDEIIDGVFKKFGVTLQQEPETL